MDTEPDALGGRFVSRVSPSTSQSCIEPKLTSGSALKTGGPELLREHYDGLANESTARGEQYRAALDDADAEAQVAAAVGVEMADLRPGMALASAGRKRGWRDGALLDDWTKLGGVRA